MKYKVNIMELGTMHTIARFDGFPEHIRELNIGRSKQYTFGLSLDDGDGFLYLKLVPKIYNRLYIQIPYPEDLEYEDEYELEDLLENLEEYYENNVDDILQDVSITVKVEWI